MRLSKILTIAAIAAALSAFGGTAQAFQVGAHRTTYALQGDNADGMPYRIVLRHCAPAEDTLAQLRLVDYRPADGVAVYRCVRP